MHRNLVDMDFKATPTSICEGDITCLTWRIENAHNVIFAFWNSITGHNETAVYLQSIYFTKIIEPLMLKYGVACRSQMPFHRKFLSLSEFIHVISKFFGDGLVWKKIGRSKRDYHEKIW